MFSIKANFCFLANLVAVPRRCSKQSVTAVRIPEEALKSKPPGRQKRNRPRNIRTLPLQLAVQTQHLRFPSLPGHRPGWWGLQEGSSVCCCGVSGPLAKSIVPCPSTVNKGVFRHLGNGAALLPAASRGLNPHLALLQVRAISAAFGVSCCHSLRLFLCIKHSWA